MNNKKTSIAMMLMALTGVANAGVISEIEANNTLATSQNIEGAFSTGANSDITNANLGWEWVSILGAGNGNGNSNGNNNGSGNGNGNHSYDYYSFQASAGETFIFDIDYGIGNSGSIDTEIGLWAQTGGLFFEQDDGNYQQSVFIGYDVDAGSSSSLDPLHIWTFADTGTYVIGVAEFNAWADDNGFMGNAPEGQDTYTLQVSRSVPEPASIALLGLGLVGFGFSRKRKIHS